MKFQLNLAIAALLALSTQAIQVKSATETETKTEVKAEAETEAKDYTVDAGIEHLLCNDHGCFLVSGDSVTPTETCAPCEQQCEIEAALATPNEVVVCTPEEGCFLADADSVDVNKVSLDCDPVTGECVLVPDAETGHIPSCRSEGVCYSCMDNAAAIQEQYQIEPTTSSGSTTKTSTTNTDSLSFAEKLKLMCAEESQNGLTAQTDYTTSTWSPSTSSTSTVSGWQPTTTSYSAPLSTTQSYNTNSYSYPISSSTYSTSTGYQAPTYSGSGSATQETFSTTQPLTYSSTSYPQDNYSNTSGYYDHQVANFDSQHDVFDQQTYEVRIDAEADLMIALEALKNEVKELTQKLSSLESTIRHTTYVIGVNSAAIADNNSGISQNIAYLNEKIERLEKLHQEARNSETALDQNRDALVLYCQQFAFAPEMVAPCAALLSCSDRELPYKWQGHFDHHAEQHNHEQGYTDD